MTVQPIRIDVQQHGQRILAEPSADRTVRYRLDVIGGSVADVIASAGGWLFDRAMSGWDVNLLVAEPTDPRSLQILGITTLPSQVKWPGMQALAVAEDVFNADASVRETVVTALDRGLTEITLWGNSFPSEVDQRTERVQHRPSAAARAFKAHALAAAALAPDSAARVETFRSATRWNPPYEPDLLPIG